jgi:hypothetical protein
MSLIVPYLGPNNWKGKDILLHRDLLKTNHLHRAVVCYGMKDADGRFQYLTAAEAEQSGYTLDLVEQESMTNMLYLDQQEDVDWVPILTQSQGKDVTILTKRGGDFTASNILRSDILSDLQHYFEGSSVAIGIPNRNTLIACGEPILMLEYLKRQYQESVSRGYEQVSDMVYLAKGGQLIGASPYPGTEEQVDRALEDVQTVSLHKSSSSSASLKKSSTATVKNKRPKTLINMEKRKKVILKRR